MEVRDRRTVARLIRFGLVALAVLIAGSWMARRVPKPDRLRVERSAPSVDQLAAGDVRIFNEDSTVDVILAGDRISAGLSPQKLAEVRAEIAKSSEKDTSGLGGSIAAFVKEQVADKIGMRAVYPVADVREIRYDDGRILVTWRDGKEGALLGNVKVDDDELSNRFSREAADRLIAAVRARMAGR